jgi:hypothetical protein
VRVAGVILSVGAEPKLPGRHALKRSRTAQLVEAAGRAGLEEVVVVVDDPLRASDVPESATVLLNDSSNQAAALRAAVDWCSRAGHQALIVAVAPDPVPPGRDAAAAAACWRALAAAE